MFLKSGSGLAKNPDLSGSETLAGMSSEWDWVLLKRDLSVLVIRDQEMLKLCVHTGEGREDLGRKLGFMSVEGEINSVTGLTWRVMLNYCSQEQFISI